MNLRHDAAVGDQQVVLVVDDEEPVVELLTYVVADAGYTPLTALNGSQAMEVAREHWPAVLITDLMMPYLSGADLIAALKEEADQSGRPRVPAVLITGAGHAAALSAGADAVLAKPFELADLDKLLRRFLGPPTAAETAAP
jgi:two-component system chemotaxis response regulator CheY